MKIKLPILINASASLVLPLTSIASCSKQEDYTNIRFIQDNFYSKIGETQKLILNKSTNTKFNWYSSDENIATIDKDGNVTGHQIGTTTILLASSTDQYIDTCTVTVVGNANSFRFGGHIINKSGVVFEQYGQTVTYDFENNKLTLNNATIKASEIGCDKQLIAVDGEQINFCNFMISFPDNMISTKFNIELKGENYIIDDIQNEKERHGAIYVGDNNTLTISGGGSLLFETKEVSQFMIYAKDITLRNCTLSNKEYSSYEYGVYGYDVTLDNETKFTFNGDYKSSKAAISAMHVCRYDGYEPESTNEDYFKVIDAVVGIKAGQVYLNQAHIEMQNVATGIAADDSVSIENHSHINITAEQKGIECKQFGSFYLNNGSQVTIEVTHKEENQGGVICGNCLIEGCGPNVEKAQQTTLNAHLARSVALSAFRVIIFNFANVSLSSDNGSGLNVNNSTTEPLKDTAYVSITSSWLTTSGTIDETKRLDGDGSMWGAGYFSMDEKYTKFEDGYENKYHIVTKRLDPQYPPVFTFLPYGVEEIQISAETGLPTNSYLGKISIEPIEVEP